MQYETLRPIGFCPIGLFCVYFKSFFEKSSYIFGVSKMPGVEGL